MTKAKPQKVTTVQSTDVVILQASKKTVQILQV